jgi:hypothetical protein
MPRQVFLVHVASRCLGRPCRPCGSCPPWQAVAGGRRLMGVWLCCRSVARCGWVGSSSRRLRCFALASPRFGSSRRASPLPASCRVAARRLASPRVAAPRVAAPRVAAPRVASRCVVSCRVVSPRVGLRRIVSLCVVSPALRCVAWRFLALSRGVLRREGLSSDVWVDGISAVWTGGGRVVKWVHKWEKCFMGVFRGYGSDVSVIWHLTHSVHQHEHLETRHPMYR